MRLIGRCPFLATGCCEEVGVHWCNAEVKVFQPPFWGKGKGDTQKGKGSTPKNFF